MEEKRKHHSHRHSSKSKSKEVVYTPKPLTRAPVGPSKPLDRMTPNRYQYLVSSGTVDQIRAKYQKGFSKASLAREHGVSTYFITKVTKDIQLDFKPKPVAVAQEPKNRAKSSGSPKPNTSSEGKIVLSSSTKPLPPTKKVPEVDSVPQYDADDEEEYSYYSTEEDN